MNANASNAMPLTTNSTSFEGYPAWSPDGTTIVFESGRPPANGLDLL
jgi:Tol biopolymer transport system component